MISKPKEEEKRVTKILKRPQFKTITEDVVANAFRIYFCQFLKEVEGYYLYATHLPYLMGAVPMFQVMYREVLKAQRSFSWIQREYSSYLWRGECVSIQEFELKTDKDRLAYINFTEAVKKREELDDLNYKDLTFQDVYNMARRSLVVMRAALRMYWRFPMLDGNIIGVFYDVPFYNIQKGFSVGLRQLEFINELVLQGKQQEEAIDSELC